MNIDERTLIAARYIVKYRATVRDVAGALGYGKSTIHADLTKRLEGLDKELFLEVREILDKNYSEKHLRGGQSTKLKYVFYR